MKYTELWNDFDAPNLLSSLGLGPRATPNYSISTFGASLLELLQGVSETGAWNYRLAVLYSSTMSHPRLQDLTVEHGQIFRKRGLINEPYMQTPPIQVESRLNFEQLSEGKWLFNFHLNNSPDEIWKEILGSRLGNVQFAVERNILAFTDIPINLQSDYDSVKKAMAETNRAYEEERQSLIAKIQEWGKLQATKANQQAIQLVQKLWDELKL